MAFDFNSRRSPVLARNGMVAASQPLAAIAGLRILMQGGNAADAVIATAAALNVTEPTSTGIGGDCFALFYDANACAVTALNGSGRAPAALTIDLIKRQVLHQSQIANPYHAHTITVPGACAGWFDLIARHGTMPMRALRSIGHGVLCRGRRQGQRVFVHQCKRVPTSPRIFTGLHTTKIRNDLGASPCCSRQP